MTAIPSEQSLMSGADSRQETLRAAGGHPKLVNILFLVALTVDLLTPFLIARGILPAQTRWLSHAAIAVMLGGVLTRMLVFNRIPSGIWPILGISLIGVATALLRGQGVVETGWGWWIMLQYPLVALFAYLQPDWPEQFAVKLRRACVGLLAFEVVVQVVQYLSGVKPGDQLAGTFGDQGTGSLIIFIEFVLCLALGQWLLEGKWKTLLTVLVLGVVSSVLGEVKLFPLAAAALAAFTVAIVVMTGKQSVMNVIAYVLILFLAGYVFVQAYDSVVTSGRQPALMKFLTDPELLSDYMNRSEQRVAEGVYYYDFGRNFALEYGWKTINQDTVTALFGFGLGARGESRTLGTAGTALVRGGLGMNAGTSLLVLMQELGIFGLLAFTVFILYVIVRLGRDIQKEPLAAITELRYGLLLFTALWPLMLWYNTVLTLRVPMLLYWVALGYVLRTSDTQKEEESVDG